VLLCSLDIYKDFSPVFRYSLFFYLTHTFPHIHIYFIKNNKIRTQLGVVYPADNKANAAAVTKKGGKAASTTKKAAAKKSKK
jgi:hypothetical protein